MSDDFTRTFAEIFPDPRDLKRQVTEILPFIKERKNNKLPNLRLLAIENTEDECSKNTQGASLSQDNDDQSSWNESHIFSNENQQQEIYRAFTSKDAEDPNLQLTLIPSEDPMYNMWKRYLAVSYCWPSAQDSTDHLKDLNLPVTIKDIDLTKRPARALPHVIRRAIRHAADLGLKYIWLDQECIDQNTPSEKETAIQCMDYIYWNAHHVICLLQLHIADPDQINLLETLHRLNDHDVRDSFISMQTTFRLEASPKIATLLASILSDAAADKYFTRAWTTHERLCASDVKSRGFWASIESGLESSIRGEACIIGMDQLQDAREMVSYLENTNQARQREEDVRRIAHHLDRDSQAEQNGEDPLPLWDTYGKEECLAAARVLRDAMQTFEAAVGWVRPAAVRRCIDLPRNFYNPLQIVRRLAPLECLYPSDKIAMVANICQWAKRLDTREVRDHGWSFSLCVWVLAMANGDGSFLCREECCVAEGVLPDAWTPSAQIRISEMHCGGLLDDVAMAPSEEGLQTQGWLWSFDRFIDLSELMPVIEAIDRDVPDVRRRTNHPVEKESLVEDTTTKLKEFFWALLLKLFQLKEFDAANLIWEATKRRTRGGFYGRSLMTSPISTFDKIVDPNSGNYIGCYDALGIPKEFEDSDLIMDELLDTAMIYLRQSCAHCRERWYPQGLTGKKRNWADQGGDLSDEEREDLTLENLEPPSHTLLGNYEQLAGMEWMRNAIVNRGGLSVCSLVEGKELSTSDKRDFYSVDLRAEERPTQHKIALTDHRSTDGNDAHVYALHREISKYEEGDGKALSLLHSFDVWLKDAPSHTDGPFCWAAERKKGGIEIGASSNVLFDIGGTTRMKYVLGWPDVYDHESWGS